MDSKRLTCRRGYARCGTVSELKITTGVVRADVQGTRIKPCRVELHLQPFTPAQWDRVLMIVSSQLGHVAALLGGKLPPEVVADVAEAGLLLLPGTGDIRPSCSCPDFTIPCKHAEAVCYLVATELDRDPFGLLAVRGRGRDAVLAALREMRAATVGGASWRVETDEPGCPLGIPSPRGPPLFRSRRCRRHRCHRRPREQSWMRTRGPGSISRATKTSPAGPPASSAGR